MDFVEGVGRRANVEGAEFMSWVRVGRQSLNGNENNFLLRNLGGAVPRFVDTGYATGTDLVLDGRGACVLDFDRDGDLDIIVQSIEKPVVLYVNQGAPGHWLQVDARGAGRNRLAVGARVEVRLGNRVLTREVSTTAGYVSGRSRLCHFGLGDATRADEVAVFWPDGTVTRQRDVAADQRLRVVQDPAGTR